MPQSHAPQTDTSNSLVQRIWDLLREQNRVRERIEEARDHERRTNVERRREDRRHSIDRRARSHSELYGRF